MDSVAIAQAATVTILEPMLESLTPDSSTPESNHDGQHGCSTKTTVQVKVEEQEDAFYDVEQENVAPLLSSTPPHQQEAAVTVAATVAAERMVENRESLTTISTTTTKVLVDNNKSGYNKLPPSIPTIKEGCKWCQRCGTTETPRWRFGPAGPLTLCNACHLRWKTQGRPSDGYSATSFPPPFYNVSPIKFKSKRKSKNDAPVSLVKRVKKNIKIIKMEEEVNNISIPAPLAPVVIEEAVTPPGTCCTMCHTSTTPLWRRGPLGYKTLCNACGLKWNKESSLLNTTGTVTPKQQQRRVPLLHQQKQYIKHGLYSIENRLANPQPKLKFSFPLPIHYGQDFFMTKEREFELPADIHQERDLGLIKSLLVKKRQPNFTRIRSNIFVERKAQLKADDQSICQCVPPTDKSQMGCGDDCLNRMLFYECDTKLCPCGTQCSNTRFQRKERKKGLQVFQTDTRGWGLRTLADIKKGELVIEYRGEIISHELCEERMCTIYVNEKNFYFLDYCNGEVIDACTKGTEARFINHSCDPNCHIEKWSLKGESHFGVFASQDIPAKAELFYDYNFSTFNDSVESQQVCYCGSKLCRGTIGKKASGSSSSSTVYQQKK